jgi:hypothetical protein
MKSSAAAENGAAINAKSVVSLQNFDKNKSPSVW